MKNELGFGSLCVQEGKELRSTPPHQLPIYATSSFVLDSAEQGISIFSGQESGHVYARYGNPTVDTVAAKLTALETHKLDMEAHGLLVSSGMAAISTLLFSVLEKGDKILTQGNIYGGTTELLIKVMEPFGIETILTDLKDLNKIEDQLKADPSIKLVYFETPANPTLACVDIAGIVEIAKRHHRYSAVDNTFCTPYLQQPFKFGVDFVIHSTTKFLNGHGNSISGFLIGQDVEFMKNKVWKTMKLAGTNSNPWDAWLLNNGLKTLELRMDRHSANAQALAEFLEAQEAVSKVNYNGLPSHPDHDLAKKQMNQFGAMLSFELKEGMETALNFINKLKLCKMAPTLGDVDTLVLHPASSSHVNIPKEVRLENGITDGLVRLSVGIENQEDIIRDIEQALN